MPNWSAVLEEIQNAEAAINSESAAQEIANDPGRVNVWQPVLSKYHPTFLSQCENAIIHGKKYVQTQLEENMFKEHQDKTTKAEAIVKSLTDYSENKSHDRHIHIDECKKLGLIVTELENDQRLQDSVLTVHHAFMHGLMNTPAYKIIENHLGRALIKFSRNPA